MTWQVLLQVLNSVRNPAKLKAHAKFSPTCYAQGHSVGGTDYLQGDFSRHVPGFGIVKVEHLETSETDEGQTFRLAFSIGDTDSEEVQVLPFTCYSIIDLFLAGM